MSSDSSSDEEYNVKLKEAVDKNFISDSFFSNDNVSSVKEEVRKLPPSARFLQNDDDQFTSIGVTKGFQSFISKQLTKLLDNQLKEVTWKNKHKLNSQREVSGGVHLFSDSSVYIDLEETSTSPGCSQKKKYRHCRPTEIAKENTDQYKSVVVSPEWVLSGSDSKNWSKKSREYRGKACEILITSEMEESEGNADDLKGTFWKKHMKAVPGRPSPQKEVKNVMQHNSSAPASSFQDFQESVRDAWEIEDDEFCVADVKISKQVAQSAALSVLNSHRNKGSDKAKQYSFESGSSVVKTNNQQLLKNAKTQPQIHSKPISVSIQPTTAVSSASETGKIAKFQVLIDSPLLNLDELRQLSWSGIPVEIRPNTWRLLAGYLPASLERRQQALERKRLDYWNLVNQYYDIKERDESHQDTYRQIHIDIPRMSPLIALFQQKSVQEMFERILFIWAIRHPASGYVQGINDLVTPFFVVFLQEDLKPGEDLDHLEVSTLPKDKINSIEADTFWCLSKFLDGIQDNYIFAQLGIQQKVNQLKELIQRIDGTLHKHLQKHGIDYLQFSFRWMNNLLTRELPLRCSIRLWDTYLAEADSFASLHKYVCAAFLLNWRQQLLNERDFQGLMLMLQNLPTQHWVDGDIGMLVAEAYRLKFTFADAPNHLQSSDNS